MWRLGVTLLGVVALVRAQHGAENAKESQILESRQGFLFPPSLSQSSLIGGQSPLQQLLLGQNPLLQELQSRQNLHGLHGAGILPGLAGLTGLAAAPGLGLLQALMQAPYALNRLGTLSLGANPLTQLAALRQSDLQARLQQGPGLLAPGRSGDDQESVKDLLHLAHILGIGGSGDIRGDDRLVRSPSIFSERKGLHEEDLSTLLQRLNAYPDPTRTLRFPSGESAQGLRSESGRSTGLGSSRYLQGLSGLERADARSSAINRIGSVESQPIFVRERRRLSEKEEGSEDNFRFPNYS